MRFTPVFFRESKDASGMSNLTSCDFYTRLLRLPAWSWQGGTKKWNFMTPYTISVMGCKGLVKTSKQRYDLMRYYTVMT